VIVVPAGAQPAKLDGEQHEGDEELEDLHQHLKHLHSIHDSPFVAPRERAALGCA
jgi:hypothetical protein